jgi:hypothetical protein
MATLRKFGRESTTVIVAVRVPDHENDGRAREEAGIGEAEEEVLPEQTALQAVSAGAAQGA